MAGSHGVVTMPVQFEVQLVDAELSRDEREREIEALLDDLQQVSGLESTQWQYLSAAAEMTPAQPEAPLSHEVPQTPPRVGLAYTLPGDRLQALLQRLCQWIEAQPLEIGVKIQIGETILQTRTRQFEDLDCVLAAVDYLLPPQRTFVAAAQRFARTGGEFTPAEAAILEDLSFRLELQPEDAEWYKDRALGPHRTRQQKLEHYAAVLDQELGQNFPLSAESQMSLQELAESLNLPPEQVERVTCDRTAQHQHQIKAASEQQEQEAELTRLQQETQLQQEAAQRQQQEQRQHRERYGQMYQQAIRTSLFPQEFDQGRLEQARQDWQISAEEAQRIAADVTAAQYGSIDSDCGADYSRLRQLLSEGQWQQADEETEQVILAYGSQDMQPLTPEQAAQLPCIDLRTIDDLWARYSDGRFGFSAQWHVYEDQNGQPRGFLRAIGWIDSVVAIFNRSKPYSQLQFDLNAPTGHLPTWRWASPSLEAGYQVDEELMRRFILRLGTCLPTASTAQAIAANTAP